MKPFPRATRSQSRISLEKNYARLKKKPKVAVEYITIESDDDSIKSLGELSGNDYEPIEISQAEYDRLSKMSNEDTSSSSEDSSEGNGFEPIQISLEEYERLQTANNEDTSLSSETNEIEFHSKDKPREQKLSYIAWKGNSKANNNEIEKIKAVEKAKGKAKTTVAARGSIKRKKKEVEITEAVELRKANGKGKAKINTAARSSIKSVLSKGKSKNLTTPSISLPSVSTSSSDSESDDDDSDDSDFHELSSFSDNNDDGHDQVPQEESEKKMSCVKASSSRKRKLVFSDADSEEETHVRSQASLKHGFSGTSSGKKLECKKNIVSSTSSCSKVKKPTKFNGKRKTDFSGDDSEVDDTKTLKELFSSKCNSSMPREQEEKKESVFEDSCAESVFEGRNEIRDVEIKELKKVEQFTREEDKKSPSADEIKKCDPSLPREQDEKNKESVPKDTSDGMCSKIREVEGIKLRATHEEEKRCLSATEIKKCTEGTKKKQQKGVNMDMCRILVDSVLNQKSIVDEDEFDHNAPTVPEFRLPLKFRFEEEVPKPVEKSEYELENERLFAILEASYYGEEIDDASGQEEAEDDNKKENSSDAENIGDNESMDSLDQSVKCLKGDHNLELDEQIGWVCTHCLHIDIAAKDILPELVEKTSQRRHARIRYPITTEKPLREAMEDFHFTPGESSQSTHSSNPGEGTVWDIKPDLRRTMHEHQQEGFEFLWKNLAGSIKCSELSNKNVGGCIISHAPGTGKTRLTIEFMHTYLKMFPNCRPLIIAPANMLLTWEEEFKKWGVEFPFHNLSTPSFSGKENTRALQKVPKGANQNTDVVRMVKMYSWNEEQSVLGMSYQLFTLLVGEEKEDRRKGDILDQIDQTDPYQVIRNIILQKPGLVVLDEGHIPRNKDSSIWNALQGIQTSKRIILSGTPFQNNFEELFDVFYIVRPSTAEKLGRDKRFSEIVRKRKSEVPECAIEELKKVMAPFVHIHRGTILKKKLPGLRECVVLLKPRSLQKNLIERMEIGNSFIYDIKVALASTHPYLFQFCKLTEQENLGVDKDALEAVRFNPDEGVKTRFVMELVRLSVARHEKVLIFSQYIKPLQLMKDHLQKTFDDFSEGRQILTIIGGTSQKARQDLINSFNDPLSQSKILLASKNCCSEGINLIGASRVVLLDVSWNPSVQRQAISRAYRLGQDKIVYTYHLMANGTNEGGKFLYQAEKERLSELVFASSEEKWEVKKNHVFEDDIILKAMTTDAKLKDMFADIIYQPNKKNLVQTLCPGS